MEKMKAMVLEKPKTSLKLKEVPIPIYKDNEILIKIKACGVCRTDLHIVDNELTEPKLPLILGHEIIGEVEKIGEKVKNFNKGDIVGVPWLGETCGECDYCKNGEENLCDKAKFTGYNKDGGFAEYTVANEKFCFKIPNNISYYNAAPLLCAGLIGYRSLKMCGNNAKKIGIYGFGAAAHIIVQVIKAKKMKFYAFTRPGDKEKQKFALELGAEWAGGSDELPPEKLDAAIIFAPVGSLVIKALESVKKGGIVVCGGIYMTNIPEFPYKILWEERKIVSVANLTRQDGEEFFSLLTHFPINTTIHLYSLEEANKALNDLREGKFKGAAVISII